jgi:hypothetical protein
MKGKAVVVRGGMGMGLPLPFIPSRQGRGNISEFIPSPSLVFPPARGGNFMEPSPLLKIRLWREGRGVGEGKGCIFASSHLPIFSTSFFPLSLNCIL